MLVTGATGAIGPSVIARALQTGWRVIALARHTPQPGVLPIDVDVLTGDVRDDAVRRRALAGADAVLHLAATLHITDPAKQARTDYDSVNVAATAALARDAIAAGVRRVVMFSTISVYGDTHGTMATEDTPPAPRTRYAQSKLAAEHTVLGARSTDRASIGSVLRLAAVYGPRVKGNYRAMLTRLATGGSLPVLPGANRRTLVFVEDVARAAMLAVDDPRAAGRVFNVTDGEPHTLQDIVAAMCEALGRPAPRVGVPARYARALVRAGRPILRGPLGRVTALVDKYVEDVAVSGSALQRDLGFEPTVSLREGWRRTVADAGLAR